MHVVLREHLRKHRPRVLFVGYGDTDVFQHMGRYDAFLATAHSFDAYLAELWQQLRVRATITTGYEDALAKILALIRAR